MSPSQQLTIEQAISRAEKAARQGNVAVARQLYSAILQHQPNHPIATQGLNELQKELPPNQSLLAQLATPSADQLNVLSNLYQSGQMARAEQACRELLHTYPQSLTVLNVLGAVLAGQGQLQQAVQIFDKIIQLKPDYADAYSNRGNVLTELGQLETAVASYDQAIQLEPNDAETYSNRGNALIELGQLEAAVANYDEAIQLEPDLAGAYSNRGNALIELGQLEAGVASYDKAIQLKPDYADAYSNRGNALTELGQLEEAMASYDRSIQLKPSLAEAYSNRGNTLRDLGRLEKAMKSYLKAIRIQPDLQCVWGNLCFTVKALQPSKGTRVDLYKQELSQNASHRANLAILEYKLDAFTPHTAEYSFKNAIKALPSKTEEEVNNPDRPHQATERPSLPGKMIALLHFGRSGTGLLHSLIDNHPQISTLPSIYFSQYFDSAVWQKLIAEGWSRVPQRFVGQFPVLFDANALNPIPTIGGKFITGLGQKEGMVNVGQSRDESLVVDRHLFCTELDQLMGYYDKLSPMDFFTLVHAAYEKALKNKGGKSTIFYHIHNPDHYAKLNFLRYNPEARIVMMVREPLQSCESWVKHPFGSNDYDTVSTRIITMLYDIDQIAFRTQDSVGVRLEDLKTYPQETMASLCDWMEIEEQQSLYEMTAQGKKWWGDPSSPDYGDKGMSPFGDSSIKRAIGSVFSEKDQFVLRTLFYPFSVRFGYIEEDLVGFKRDLQEIRPLLDEMFDFEKKMAQESKVDLELFTRSGSYRYFRAGLVDRWKVLNEFNNYPHMLTPLKINAKLTV